MYRSALGFLSLTVIACVSISPSTAQPSGDQEDSTASLPPALAGIGIEEHLGTTLPLDLGFADENGKQVFLREFFRDKPVILSFAYYRCPMLCNLVLSGMVDGFRKSGRLPGDGFETITISIDPREGPEQAQAKKKTHIEALGAPLAAQGWHFLTGSEEAIARATEALGFRFGYNRATGEYYHAAAIFALSPQGRICRYLYGVEYKPQDVKLALLEAKDGQALSVGEKIELFCYRYDPNAKGYSLVAMKVMKAGGGLVLAALALILGFLWTREAGKTRSKLEGKKTS